MGSMPGTRPGLYGIRGMDTPNARRMSKGMNDSENPPFVFGGNMNMAHKPAYYVRIFNVYQMQHVIERPWVHYNPAKRAKAIVVPACEDDQPYSNPFVIQDIVQVPVTNEQNNEFLTRGVDGRFLAQDAINPDEPQGDWKTVRPLGAGLSMNWGTNLYNWGLFWTTGEIPSEEEVGAARTRLETNFNRLVQEAQELWIDPNTRKQIGNTHRRAASYFDLTFEWNQLYKKQMACAGCGIMVPQSVVICPKCPAVYNWEKALALGLRTIDQAIAAGVMEPQARSMAPAGKESKPRKSRKKDSA